MKLLKFIYNIIILGLIIMIVRALISEIMDGTFNTFFSVIGIVLGLIALIVLSLYLYSWISKLYNNALIRYGVQTTGIVHERKNYDPKVDNDTGYMGLYFFQDYRGKEHLCKYQFHIHWPPAGWSDGLNPGSEIQVHYIKHFPKINLAFFGAEKHILTPVRKFK